MREFAEFSTGVAKGLAKAYTEDIDVFLLFTAGGLLGSRSQRLRGIGKVLTLYTIYRRVDQYVGVLQHTAQASPRTSWTMVPTPHPNF